MTGDEHFGQIGKAVNDMWNDADLSVQETQSVLRRAIAELEELLEATG